MIEKQAAMMAYIDVFWLVAGMIFLVVPLILTMKPKRGKSADMIH
ncbi:MAG: hypothetical protein ACHQ6U_08305 [Thermodesulfobacteriota bacterium]